ncbi:AAA family ATPase [Celerinatantimonas sp. YJH-8]|uniref:AAA family ATPase n=1 Tax=Celerinatantimonas sp. YJH-8 TaxID=3228714 RepID=UPI0038C1B4DE
MMSETITLKNVASYTDEEPQIIDITKPYGFIYGLNGTGKSTISNLFYNSDDEKYNDCIINLEREYKPFVYNNKFVEDVFYKNNEQAGIFTLSKNNKDLSHQIEVKEKVRDDLLKKYNNTKDKIVSEKERTDKNIDGAINNVYKKLNIIKDYRIYDFIEGFKRPKQKFYSKLITIPVDNSKVDISKLEDEYLQLMKFKDIIVNTININEIPQLTDEEYKVLEEPIISSSHSQLSDLIDVLGNMEWVKLGRDKFLNNSKNICPFCQSESIDDNFRLQLSKLFDNSFEKQLEKLNELKNSYSEKWKMFIDVLKNSIESSPLFDKDNYNLDIIEHKILNDIQNNINIIDKKLHDTSIQIKENLNVDLSDLISIVDEINLNINEINKKTKQITKSKSNIKSKVWQYLRNESEDIINIINDISNKNESNINQLKLNLDKIKKEGEENTKEIKKLRSQMSNIDDTIIKINDGLRCLGVTNFEIVKSSRDSKLFSIQRDKTDEVNVYKSLSEGEKTLITFLYFLEMCSGSQTATDSISDSEKVVIVDDPVSSLSQNYIYEIASLIHSKLLVNKSYYKVIVLTHSLFFFHELIKLSSNHKDKYSLYCIKKHKHSLVQPIGFSELKNEYQSLWQILIDAKEHKINPVVIPNVMRNILEHYYGFVHKKNSLGQVLNELVEKESTQELKSFFRYINRQSHSDPVNLGLIADIDPDVYLDKFKEVFCKTGDEGHYLKMMEV